MWPEFGGRLGYPPKCSKMYTCFSIYFINVLIFIFIGNRNKRNVLFRGVSVNKTVGIVDPMQYLSVLMLPVSLSVAVSSFASGLSTNARASSISWLMWDSPSSGTIEAHRWLYILRVKCLEVSLIGEHVLMSNKAKSESWYEFKLSLSFGLKPSSALGDSSAPSSNLNLLKFYLRVARSSRVSLVWFVLMIVEEYSRATVIVLTIVLVQLVRVSCSWKWWAWTGSSATRALTISVVPCFNIICRL